MPKSTARHPKYKTTLYPARLSEDFIIGCGKQDKNKMMETFCHCKRGFRVFDYDNL